MDAGKRVRPPRRGTRLAPTPPEGVRHRNPPLGPSRFEALRGPLPVNLSRFTLHLGGRGPWGRVHSRSGGTREMEPSAQGGEETAGRGDGPPNHMGAPGGLPRSVSTCRPVQKGPIPQGVPSCLSPGQKEEQSQRPRNRGLGREAPWASSGSSALTRGSGKPWPLGALWRGWLNHFTASS